MPAKLFQPGQSGNPKGPPLGMTKGQSRALKALDAWFEDERNRRKNIERLTEEAMRYPIRGGLGSSFHILHFGFHSRIVAACPS